MEDHTLSKRTTGFGLALAIACLVNALVVIVKEKSDAVMSGMKKIAGHHWTTHSLLVLLLFLGGGALLTKVGGGHLVEAERLPAIIATAVGTAALIIVGFYLFVD